jgi:hypothetical protein
VLPSKNIGSTNLTLHGLLDRGNYRARHIPSRPFLLYTPENFDPLFVACVEYIGNLKRRNITKRR